MHRQLTLFALVLVGALALSACGNTGATDADSGSTALDTLVVESAWARASAGMAEHGEGHAMGGHDDDHAMGEHGSGGHGEHADAANGHMAGAANSAAYMVIRNSDSVPDLLLSATSDVAEAVELHTVEDDGGVMRMRPVEGGIEVPANGEVALQPGGFHVMLIGLTEELTAGQTFELTLQFEQAGERTIEVEVRDS